MGTTLADIGMSWVQLGISGAALFLILVFMVYSIKSNNKTIQQFAKLSSESISVLCGKIDKLTDNNSYVVEKLAITISKQNEDQQTNASYLVQILDSTKDNTGGIQSLNTKIDSLILMKCAKCVLPAASENREQK